MSTLLDVTPEFMRGMQRDGSKDAAFFWWAVHHGYWIAADGSNVLTVMPPRSRWTRIANWFRFKGLLPWKRLT
jgi:hypothetical protein